ncbi:hypothetical protein HDU67_007398 [Dinochytrium kinnereticum]|nr:hypothetical protein HDU67_007398 [Dinochytrium kinnereticum]
MPADEDETQPPPYYMVTDGTKTSCDPASEIIHGPDTAVPHHADHDIDFDNHSFSSLDPRTLEECEKGYFEQKKKKKFEEEMAGADWLDAVNNEGVDPTIEEKQPSFEALGPSHVDSDPDFEISDYRLQSSSSRKRRSQPGSRDRKSGSCSSRSKTALSSKWVGRKSVPGSSLRGSSPLSQKIPESMRRTRTMAVAEGRNKWLVEPRSSQPEKEEEEEEEEDGIPLVDRDGNETFVNRMGMLNRTPRSSGKVNTGAIQLLREQHEVSGLLKRSGKANVISLLSSSPVRNFRGGGSPPASSPEVLGMRRESIAEVERREAPLLSNKKQRRDSFSKQLDADVLIPSPRRKTGLSDMPTTPKVSMGQRRSLVRVHNDDREEVGGRFLFGSSRRNEDSQMTVVDHDALEDMTSSTPRLDSKLSRTRRGNSPHSPKPHQAFDLQPSLLGFSIDHLPLRALDTDDAADIMAGLQTMVQETISPPFRPSFPKSLECTDTEGLVSPLPLPIRGDGDVDTFMADNEQTLFPNEVPLSVETLESPAKLLLAVPDFSQSSGRQRPLKDNHLDPDIQPDHPLPHLQQYGRPSPRSRRDVLVSATVPMSPNFSTQDTVIEDSLKPSPRQPIPDFQMEEEEEALLHRRPLSAKPSMLSPLQRSRLSVRGSTPFLSIRSETPVISVGTGTPEGVYSSPSGDGLGVAHALPIFSTIGITYLSKAEPEPGKRIYVRGIIDAVRPNSALRRICATLCDGTSVLEVSLSPSVVTRFGRPPADSGNLWSASKTTISSSSPAERSSQSRGIVENLRAALLDIDGVFEVEFPKVFGGSPSPLREGSGGRASSVEMIALPEVLSVTRMTVEAWSLVWKLM